MEEKFRIKIEVANSEAIAKIKQTRTGLTAINSASNTTSAQNSVNALNMAIAKIAPTASNAVANVTTFASTLSTIWNTSRILSYDKAIDRLCDKIDDFTKKGKNTDNLEYQVGLLEELKEGAEGAGKGFLNLGKGAKGAVAGLTATVAVIIAMVAALKRLVRLANEVSAIGAEIDDMAQKLQMSNS